MDKQTQEFDAPKINASSSDIVHYQVSGSAKEGGLLTSAFQTLSFRTLLSSIQPFALLSTNNLCLEYNCVKIGVTAFTVTIDVAPYAPIAFSWKKACGTHAPGFSVGTTSNFTDVVEDGAATMLYVRPNLLLSALPSPPIKRNNFSFLESISKDDFKESIAKDDFPFLNF